MRYEISQEGQQNKKANGHPPIEYIDGNYACPERGLVRPEFDIGPEEYHRKLFIEYERTFGRGQAKFLTHGGANYIPGTDSEKKFNEKFGPNVIEEYREFSNKIRFLLYRGKREDCEDMIIKLGEFRNRHPNLYSDVKDLNAPKKKFKILGEEKK